MRVAWRELREQSPGKDHLADPATLSDLAERAAAIDLHSLL